MIDYKFGIAIIIGMIVSGIILLITFDNELGGGSMQHCIRSMLD